MFYVFAQLAGMHIPTLHTLDDLSAMVFETKRRVKIRETCERVLPSLSSCSGQSKLSYKHEAELHGIFEILQLKGDKDSAKEIASDSGLLASLKVLYPFHKILRLESVQVQ